MKFWQEGCYTRRVDYTDQLTRTPRIMWSSAPSTKHTLTIWASSDYEGTDRTVVPVNSETPLKFENKDADVELLIRVNGFAGSSSHSSDAKESPYFNERKDTNISIQLSLTPKVAMTGDQLLFGNDFAYPIKDFLPYGTGTGLKLFKKYVDPSVDGDLYLEEPFLYGKALSSFNVINTKSGGLIGDEHNVNVIQEDMSNDGDIELSVPEAATQRQKFFQKTENLEKFEFVVGKTYQFDFFSGLVSLKGSDIQISLPGGYELNLSRYLNDKFNSVRYVLKKVADSKEMGVKFGTPLLVITFQLDSEDVEEEDDSEEDEDDGIAEEDEVD